MSGGWIPKKDASNQSYISTEMEANIGDYLGARHTTAFDGSGLATINMPIPSDALDKTIDGIQVARLIFKGEAWVDNYHIGDYCMTDIVDKDGVAYPAGTVMGAFYDTALPLANQGCYLVNGYISLGGIAGYGHLPSTGSNLASFYMRTRIYAGDSRTTGSAYCNIHWLKPTV